MKLLLVSWLVLVTGYPAYGAIISVDDPRVVKTQHGTVEGSSALTRGGRTFYSYKGIPYANYPGRFQVARDFANWTYVLPAKEHSEDCAHSDMNNVNSYMGTENCLFLNIFTPNPKPKQKYAVFFFIPGGTLGTASSNALDGHYLLDEDIVVVTVSSRGGVLGFFTFNTGLQEGLPGNLGLKDQALALRWVQKNIHAFGGDPDKVTLGGFSGGAAAAHHHVLSTMSAGLFRGAIIRGGTGVSFWAWQKEARKNAVQFAGLLGCGTLADDNSNIKDVVTCLREVPVQKLVSMQAKLKDWFQYPLLVFTGQVEPVGGYGGYNFITEVPRKALKQGKHSYVPMMVGINREEENLLAYPIIKDKSKILDMQEDWNTVAPPVFGLLHWEAEDKLQCSKQLKQHFFPNMAGEGVTNTTLREMLHDAYFHEAMDMVVRIHSTFAPVYPFVLSLKTESSFMNHMYKTEGAQQLTHGDGLQFMFPGGGYGATEYGAKTKYKDMLTFSKNFVRMIASFVQDLKPERWDGQEWEPVVNQPRPDLVEYVNLGHTISTLTYPGKIERLGAFRKIRRWDIYDVNV